MFDGGNNWLFDEEDPDQAGTEEAVFYLRNIGLREKARELSRIAGATCTEGKTSRDSAFIMTNTLRPLLLEIMVESDELERMAMAARAKHSLDEPPSGDEEGPD